MARALVASALVAAIVEAAGSEIQVEENKWGWLDLDEYNFDLALQHSKPLFVKFFAPWCKQSMKMAKEFQKLTKQQDTVRIGRVDGTKSPDLSQRFGVHEYPTLLLFTQQGKEIRSYTGDRVARIMIPWMERFYNHTPLHDPTKRPPERSMYERLRDAPWTMKAVALLFVLGFPVSIGFALYDSCVAGPRKKRERRAKAALGKTA